ncbi:hypothetical protein B0H14DRAFT_3850557 [Mycena olivaceomarginata]|nr:hypothetical protein B0H14DRAFT_3850557 [Mycena olivaceomarginata]
MPRSRHAVLLYAAIAAIPLTLSGIAPTLLVLPSGLFVPHYIPGSNLRARITEYQRQSTTAALRILSPASAVVVAPTGPEHEHSTLRPTIEPIPISFPHTSPPPSLPALDVDERRIAKIQRELASLHARDDAAPMSQPPQLPNTAPTSLPIASRSPPHDLSSQTYRLPAASQRPTDILGHAPPTAPPDFYQMHSSSLRAPDNAAIASTTVYA